MVELNYKGDILKSKDTLEIGDYLRSKNKIYYAILQDDASFCIYQGEPCIHKAPDILWNNRTTNPVFMVMNTDGRLGMYEGSKATYPPSSAVVWYTQEFGPVGEYFARLEDDGDFRIYQGNPLSITKEIWHAKVSDSIVSITVKDVNYDLGRAKILSKDFGEPHITEIKNDSNIIQHARTKIDFTYEESDEWGDEQEVSVGTVIETEIEVPYFGGTNIQLNANYKSMFSRNKSRKTSTTETVEVEVDIPSHSKTIVTIRTLMCELEVPYTITYDALMQSGNTKTIEIDGIYVGTNKYTHNIDYA
jgi:hypothetical protein